MDGMNDEEFCEVIEGTFASSQEDRVGDRIPTGGIERFEEQIRENPEKRKLLDEHNQNKVIGQIVDVWSEWDEENEILFLKGEIGIFKGNEHIVEEMKSGEKSGLSIGAYSYPSISREDWGDQSPDALIEIPADEKKDFCHKAKQYDIKYRLRIEKSFSGVDFAEVLIDNHESVIELAKAVGIWYIGRKSSDASIKIPEVNLYKNDINVDIGVAINNAVIRLNEEAEEENIIEKETMEDVIEEEVESIIEKKDK